MTATLFEVSPGDVVTTTDDWYTPRWVFDAAGLMFDLDVCAPVDPAFQTCPAKGYLTPVEDGLTASWRGLVWCNPPYSNVTPWVDRFVKHETGLALVPMAHSQWRGVLLRNTDAMAVLTVAFSQCDGRVLGRPQWCSLLAARGAECVAALARVAQADRYAQGAYHVRPVNDA